MSVTYGEVCSISSSYTKCNKWTINDFALNSVKDEVQSPIFSTTFLNQEYKWQLYLYPNGKREEDLDEDLEEDKDYLSVFLYNRSNMIFTGSIRFSIFNNNNEVITSSESDKLEIVKNESFGLHQFVKSSAISTDVLGNNDTLMIVCEFRYNDEETRRKKSQMKMEAQRIEEFESQQENLMLEGKFSDVTFIIDNSSSDPSELYLHKCVMANASSVFAAMFESNPKKRTIEIKDVDYNTFYEAVWFAYTGNVPDIIKGNLLAAANKFKINGLKLLCEMALCDELSVNNVFESIRLADVHEAAKLKSKAIEFIALNGKDVVDKPEFQRLPADVLYRVCSQLIQMINRSDD